MAFVPGTAASVTTTVELRFKARNLINLDWLSKSDPQVPCTHAAICWLGHATGTRGLQTRHG
jgi:hypothetical protein